MTNPIGRRLGRLESEIERRTDPGFGPVFRLIDDPRDPENAKRLEEAEAFKRDRPNGLIFRRVIVRPGDRKEPTSPKQQQPSPAKPGRAGS